MAPASPPSRTAGIPPTPPRPPPAPCAPRVRPAPLPEPTPRLPTPACSVALGSPLQVGGGRVPSLGDCLPSAQRGGPGQVGSLFSAVLQTPRLPSNCGALRPAPCAWGGGCAPPIPPLPATVSLYPSSSAGWGAPRGQCPPLRQGRQWISCPGRGCLLAQGRGRGFAIFNSPRLGSVPGGAAQLCGRCDSVGTAASRPDRGAPPCPREPQAGLRGVCQGWGPGWHVYASTHPASTRGLGKARSAGGPCLHWVLGPCRASRRQPRPCWGKGAPSLQPFWCAECDGWISVACPWSARDPQGHGGSSQPSRGFLQPLLT